MIKERVELHCHTNMTAMEGVSTAEELISKAFKMGMLALAITDRFGVQAFPDAYEALQNLNLIDDKFKVIYGTEILIDDDSIQRTIDGVTYSYVDLCRVIILVKNQVGLENLYKIISCVNSPREGLTPEINKDFLNRYRDGLLFGCCLFKGQLAEAYLNGFSEDVLLKLAEFYDFLEIETDANTRFQYDRYYDIETHSDLYDNLNKTIIKIGEKTGKYVIASSNVYYTDSSQELSYRFLLEATEADENGIYYDHHLMSTEEMLEAFNDLGEEVAQKVVVENPNKMADMIEEVTPVSEERYYPQIPDADDYIRNMSLIEAQRIYGEELPSIVQDRLDNEVNGIIENGYSSIFIIYAKITEECWTRGYLNGTRGCVGGSLVAYLLGITGTNPLPPHYLCRNCNYSDFEIKYDSDFRPGYVAADLPDKTCPICGKKLIKDGYDIPVEPFMGVNYEKEPYISLNVPYELKNYLQKCLKKIDGIGDVVFPGTIGTIYHQMAEEFTDDYIKNHSVGEAEYNDINHSIERLRLVKKEVGINPSAVFAIPDYLDIKKITPIDNSWFYKDMYKTHFEYHGLSKNLLQVSICDHDAPTMLKRLEECTGVNPEDIPLQDDKMLSLLYSTDALGVIPEQIKATVGSLGAGGFSDQFILYAMVPVAKPKNLSDIIKLYGLAHGTGTWIDNACDLIESGEADISSVIALRDDVMQYLMDKGIDRKTAYEIMEYVRKGRAYKSGLKQEWAELMKNHGIPDWYINSCEKIQYLFPKAHAAIYALLSWRMLYYKLYYPEAFYTVWFEILPDYIDIDAEFLRAGYDNAIKKYDEILNILREADTELTEEQEEEYYDMELTKNEIPIVLEMYSRGVDVEKVIALANAKQPKPLPEI